MVCDPRDTPVIGVVLAGGSGTRLWPLSRAEAPKHLVPLLGDRSLFQQTLLRLHRALPTSPLVVVGAAAQANPLAQQIAALELPVVVELLLEPQGRNTAAAVALAARFIAERYGGEGVMWVCPSDHRVARPEVLEAAFRLALPEVRQGAIATFGIAPDRPETGFGWIELGPVQAREGDLALHAVERFLEKPDAATAERLLASGRYVWNSGMFVMRADVLLAELACHAPEIHRSVATAFAATDRRRQPLTPPAAAYGAIPEAPIDKAVMEHSRRMRVVPCDPGWSDLGSYRALFEVAARDAEGLATRGEVVAEDAHDCLLHTEGRLLAAVGVRELAVVATGDAVLVARLDDAEGVRRLVRRLQAAGRPETRRPAVELAPWGCRRLQAVVAGWTLHELRIEPGARFALPPAPRAHYLVLAGEGLARLAEGAPLRLVPGMPLPPADDGRVIEAGGIEPLVLLEVGPAGE